MNELLATRMYRLMGEGLDISEHLGLLRGLAMDHDVKKIVELGFRTGVSATALATAGKPLVCYDIESCTKAVQKLRILAPNFSFVKGDSLRVKIPQCDLLHIDSLHTYAHLSKELELHASSCSKWIAVHDVETFGAKGKDGSRPGLVTAILEFLNSNPTWLVHLHLRNNNGMILLRRRGS